jgi:hypothetical protein
MRLFVLSVPAIATLFLATALCDTDERKEEEEEEEKTRSPTGTQQIVNWFLI